VNVCLEYLYRDAGNNKQWGAVVFKNTNDVDLCILENKIKSALIDGEFFLAEKVGLPPLKFHHHIEELDHGWHEYFVVRQTIETANDKYERDIGDFIEELRTITKDLW